MRKMSKEEFLEILSRQQRSGLTIKTSVLMKPIPNLVLLLEREVWSLTTLSCGKIPSEEFAPVNLTSPSTSNPSYDRVAMGSEEIRIEFPGGIIARFSGMAESHAAMQLLTQICGHHVLPE